MPVRRRRRQTNERVLRLPDGARVLVRPVRGRCGAADMAIEVMTTGNDAASDALCWLL